MNGVASWNFLSSSVNSSKCSEASRRDDLYTGDNNDDAATPTDSESWMYDDK